MSGITVNLQGYQKVLTELKKYPVRKEKALDKILERGAVRIQNTASRYVVAQTERSKNLHNQIMREKINDGHQIYALADHAPYVEFGTGKLVNIPSGKAPYAAQFKGRGLREVNLRARPFMFPAYKRHAKEIRKAAAKAIKTVK